MLPIETLLFLIAGASLGGVVMGLVGFGTGLTAYGLWLIVLEPRLAVPLVGVCSLATTVFTLRAYSHAISLKRLAPFFLGAAFTLPLGIYALTALDPALFKLIIGLFLIVYVPFRWLVIPRLAFPDIHRAWDGGVGVVSGFLCGLAAIPGPLTTVWSSLRGWSKDEQRAVYQPFNQIMTLIAMIGYGYEGMLTRELGVISLYCVPAALCGMALGMIGYRRLDESQFRRAVLMLLLASGIMLVALNIVELV